jgi:putative polyhydroxyalkanoate system protein
LRRCLITSNVLEIPHALPPDELRAKMEAACRKLEARFGVRCSWPGANQLKVERPGLIVGVRLEATRVKVEIQMGFLLRLFQDRICAGIAEELSAFLASPPPPSPRSPAP